MNNKLFVLLFLITVLPLSMQGQDTTESLGTLTLKECIKIAQKNSPRAKSYEYALIASRWQYQELHADLLPSLVLSGNAPNYSKSISNFTDSTGIHFFSNQQSIANVSLGVNENILPTGGTISLSSGLKRLGIFHGENTYAWRSIPLQLSISQPIFKFNSLKWQHRTAPLVYTKAKKQYNQNMEDLAVQVTQSYFSVLLAKINRENAKLNVARDDSIYKIAQGRYKVGTITEPDLLQTELEFHNAQRALTTSRINYNRNINNFKILLGYPTSVTLSLKEPKNLPEISVNIVKAQRLAMQNNSLSLSFQLDKLQADKQLARARSQNGLSATLSANYGLNKRSGRFSDLYQHPLSQQFITVGFHLPLYDWGKHRAQIKSAENQERSTVNNIKFQRRQFMQKVQYQVKNFLQLRNQAKLATESDTIAVRRYHVAENRYRIGKINITDLFLAQGAKDSARQNYIRALEDFWTGWYNLRKLTLYDFQDDEPIRHTF